MRLPTALRLAAFFLYEYHDRLGNDGCNDWDVPDFTTTEEVLSIIPADEWDETHVPPNWMFVIFLAEWLEAEAKKARQA